MKNSNGKPELRIRIDTHHCQLSDAVLAKMQGDVSSLARQVAEFPVAEMQVLVEHNARSNDYCVKTSLILPGNTLVGNGRDVAVHVAFQNCLQSLEENVRGYKERLDHIDVTRQFSTEEKCLDYIEQMRWPEGVCAASIAAS